MGQLGISLAGTSHLDSFLTPCVRIICQNWSNFSGRLRICFDSALLSKTLIWFPSLSDSSYISTHIYVFILVSLPHSVDLVALDLSIYVFLFVLFTSGIGLGGILPSAACHRHLFYLQNSSHSISFTPILLSVSHTSPLLAYLLSREHPRKAEKIENTLVPVDESEAARTFPSFLAPLHVPHSLHSFSLTAIPNFCCFYEFSFLCQGQKGLLQLHSKAAKC